MTSQREREKEALLNTGRALVEVLTPKFKELEKITKRLEADMEEQKNKWYSRFERGKP